MKCQDVRKLKKFVIEKTISSIWTRSRVNAVEEPMSDCGENRNTNNSNNHHTTAAGSSVLSGSSRSSLLSCTCLYCGNCECGRESSQISDYQSACSSSTISQQRSSYKFPYKSVIFENEEIVLDKRTKGDGMSKQVNSSYMDKLKRTRLLRPLIYFNVHILLLFVGFVLKLLCYVKYALLYISKFKRFLSFLFIFSSICILKNFNNSIYFCNVMKRVLYSQNDALAKMMRSDGIPCDESLHLYFVQTLNDGLVQVEVSPDACSPIRYCIKIDATANDVSVIESSRDDDLMYECSRLEVDEPDVADRDCKRSNSFAKDVSELSKHEPVNDYMLIEVIREKLFCKSDSEDGELSCPFSDRNIIKCFDKHHSCEPKIESKTTKFNVNNQKLFAISHCYCDREFYKCLKSVATPLANLIGRVYFNNLRMKCFHFEYKYNCKLYMLGLCLSNGEPYCQAKLIENTNY